MHSVDQLATSSMVGGVDIGNLYSHSQEGGRERTSTPDYSRHHAGGNLRSEQFFGEIKNEIVFKEQENVNSRSARPSANYTYCICLNERACPWEQFSTLVEAMDQLPTALIMQVYCFSHEKNRFLATALTISDFS